MSKYYDRQGNPMDLMAWVRELKRSDVYRVAFDKVDDVEISTVWLGDHSFVKGPPLIFETMVFGGINNEYQDRYSTEAEALAGHKRIVAAVKDGVKL